MRRCSSSFIDFIAAKERKEHRDSLRSFAANQAGCGGAGFGLLNKETKTAGEKLVLVFMGSLLNSKLAGLVY